MTDRVNSGQNDDRSEILARYIINTGDTVRGAAAHFGLSKSTVHKDVSKRLKSVNPPLYAAVSEVLAKNKAERHLRGGAATKIMYLNRKNTHNCIFSSNNTIRPDKN